MSQRSEDQTAATTRKIVINRCYGGFGLSDAAYEKLIEWGVPVRAYVEQQRDPETGQYLPEPQNEGEVIFDRDLDSNPDELTRSMRTLTGRYWETWISQTMRDDPRLVRLVEELGDAANGRCAKLEIVEIPADAAWQIEEYDGSEWIAEQHRTWR